MSQFIPKRARELAAIIGRSSGPADLDAAAEALQAAAYMVEDIESQVKRLRMITTNPLHEKIIIDILLTIQQGRPA